MPPARRPAPASEPGYPTLHELSTDRRQALKLFALSAASAALGLPLVGCPGQPGAGSAPPPPPIDPPAWLPWRDDPARRPMSGEMAMPMPRTLAIVLGGGPIEVTLADGSACRLVVAVVVDASQGSPQADAKGRVAADVELIREEARALAPAALTDAAALDAFEERLRGVLGAAWPRPLEEVTVGIAEAETDAAQGAARAQEPAAAHEAASSQVASRNDLAAPREEAKREAEPAREPAALPTRAASSAPRAEQLWAPCRRPGCTTCGR